MSKILEGLDKAVAQQLQNIIRQNPKGSADEKILLGKFLGSDQGAYARNVLGKDHKGWIEHITTWLKKNQPSLQKEFTEVDFSDLESLAYDMYETYLAKQGQLGEGEVVSLQARKTPLVVAGSPYDWNVYDLRNNKMVASVIGGDRSESKLYEIRIKRSGMTDETRMPPTYLLTAGPNDTPPYKAYELVVPTERDKIEKSPGPGGTTKLHPDEDDKLRHFFKIMGSGRYYGYDVMLVEKGLDQWELVEKALGAKIMDIDDAMELGYTDVDPEDSSSIVYLGNQKNEDTAYAGGGGQGGNAGQARRKYTSTPAGLDEEQVDELKCWSGYTRVRGVPAGAPGSCKKKTKESSIMKGLNNETYLPHYTLGGKMYKSFTPADKLKNEPGSDTSDLENEANKEQLRRKMKEVLASLPERQRQVLVLRFYKNKTLDQTAEIMDVSPERIRQLEIKALHKIKTYFRGLDSFILDKARDSENWLNSFFNYNPLRTDEYKEVPGQRKIEFSKENPPDLYYLYQQFIQRMLNPENTIDPKDWIEKVNNHYGLNYSWKDYQKRGHSDHTDNWQKIINKYILKK